MIDIGPDLGLLPMASSKVILHSKVSDVAKLAALRMLTAAFRSATAK